MGRRIADTGWWRLPTGPGLLTALSVVMLVMLAVFACSSGGAATPTAGPASPSASSTGSAGSCPASAGLPANVNNHGTVASSGSQISIQANDFFFSPTCVTGVPGGQITLTVHNVGQALHNVSIPSLGIDRDVAPGQTVTIPVRMGNTPLVFFCKYHKGVGMYGALLPSGTANG
jgi:plastocyanin